MGPNGAGKTTLLRILAGTQPPDEGEVVRERGLRLGILDQELDVSSDRSVLEEAERAGDELREVAAELHALEANLDDATLERYGVLRDRFEALGGYAAESEAKRVLCGLGFKTEELTRPASTFSGGWRMRISLARLLLQQPDLLLLDEPTNHLDLESLAWFEDYLAGFEGAVVSVSHDRYFLNRTVSRIAELTARGITVYEGDYEDFLDQRDKNREMLEKSAARQAAFIKQAEKSIERFKAKATKARQAQSRLKQLRRIERIELEPESKSMKGFRFPQPPRTGRTVVELRGVRKAYGSNVVFDGLDLTLDRGQKVALVGVNGAGKTTLLRILAGALPFESGRRVLGTHVTSGYFAQHQLEALDVRRTVLQEMEAVADLESWPLMRGVLGAFLFSGDTVDKLVGVLSGGEKARLALARMLLKPTPLLLLDEPTNHLDLASRESLEAALRRFDGTLVVVSHDRYFINSVCDTVIEVAGGRIEVHPGSYDDWVWKTEQEALAAPVEVQERESDDKKAKKRQEAEVRQRLYRATKDLRAELERVEAAVSSEEARLKDIDSTLADPIVYASGRAPALLQERRKLEAALTRDMARWEDLGTRIEAAEAEIRAGE